MFITTFVSLLATAVLANTLQYRSDLDLTLHATSGFTSLSSPNPLLVFARQGGGCVTGKTACGTGCMPDLTTNTCCTDYYCQDGSDCDQDDGTCTCDATEKKCGTSCIPSDGNCCSTVDETFCAVGKYCGTGILSEYCCRDGEDPSACATRIGVSGSTSNSSSSSPLSFPSTSFSSPVRPSSTTSTSRTRTRTSSSTSSDAFTSISSSSAEIKIPPSTSSSSKSATTATTAITSEEVAIVTVTASTSLVTVSTGAAVAGRVDGRMNGKIGMGVVVLGGVLAVL